MPKIVLFLIAFCVLISATDSVIGAIPEPDVILYGTIHIDRVLVRSTDDVTIITRVDGVAGPVDSYHMGDNPAAGDHYVLRLPLESLADGGARSGYTALVGETAHIYVRRGTGAEEHIADFKIYDRGIVVQRNLSVGEGICGDLNRDCYVNWPDFGLFSLHWSESGCADPDWCGGADLKQIGKVDWVGLAEFAAHWLECCPSP